MVMSSENLAEPRTLRSRKVELRERRRFAVSALDGWLVGGGIESLRERGEKGGKEELHLQHAENELVVCFFPFFAREICRVMVVGGIGVSTDGVMVTLNWGSLDERDDNAIFVPLDY